MFIDSTKAGVEAAKIGTICVATVLYRLDPETAGVRDSEIKRCAGGQRSRPRIR
jgi:hypothetical protein